MKPSGILALFLSVATPGAAFAQSYAASRAGASAGSAVPAGAAAGTAAPSVLGVSIPGLLPPLSPPSVAAAQAPAAAPADSGLPASAAAPRSEQAVDVEISAVAGPGVFPGEAARPSQHSPASRVDPARDGAVLFDGVRDAAAPGAPASPPSGRSGEATLAGRLRGAELSLLIDRLAAAPPEEKASLRADLSRLALSPVGNPGLPYSIPHGISDEETLRLAAADPAGFVAEGRDRVWNGLDVRMRTRDSQEVPIGFGAAHLLKHASEFDAVGGIDRLLLEDLPRTNPLLSVRSRGALMHLYSLARDPDRLVVLVVAPDGKLWTIYIASARDGLSNPKSILRSFEALLNGNDAALFVGAYPDLAYLRLPLAGEGPQDLFLRYRRVGKTLDIRLMHLPGGPGPSFAPVKTSNGWLERLRLQMLHAGARERIRLDLPTAR